MARIIFSIAIILAGLFCGLLFIADASDSRAMRDARRDIAKTPPPISYPENDDLNSLPSSTFSKGTTFPEAVTVSLKNTFVAPKSKHVFVIAELSAPTANTVVAVVKCSNKKGKSLEKSKVQAVIFRPMGPVKQAVKCDLKSSKEGNTVSFTQAHVPDGAKPGERHALATITSKQNPTQPPAQEERPPYKFQPYGDLIYEMDIQKMDIRDDFIRGSWSTNLGHGRTQPANRETGYYGTLSMGAISKNATHVTLNSKRLETPIDAKDNRPPYPFMSSVLTGKTVKATHFQYGAIEWKAKMPSQKGTWPALWLLPTSGWPPEIDVYEGFSFNKEWTPAVSLSSAIHGGKGNKRSFKRSVFRLQTGDIGLSADLTKDINSYQARVTPAWITLFVNDVETVRYANPFQGKTWYPIMTVAVKARPDSTYQNGTTDMEIHSLKIWSQPASSQD